MVKRLIDTDFWQDSKVIDQFSPEDKYFMLYLLTNPKTTAIGIYSMPKKIVSFEMGYSKETIVTLIDRFQGTYKNIVYSEDKQEVAVLNTLKYTISKGGQPIEDMVQRELNSVKDDALLAEVYDNMLDWWSKSSRKIDNTIKEKFEQEILKRKVPKEKDTNTNANAYTDTGDVSWGVSPKDEHDNVPEEKGVKKKTPPKPKKSKYGDANNVLLKDDEIEKLKEKFPSDYEERINNLSYYIASKGAKYKSHYMTILAWARKDSNKNKKGSAWESYIN